MNKEGESRTVKSVAAALEIIQHLREMEGATLSELAEQVDLSQASVHAHLTTLKQAGFVVQKGHNYDVGPQFRTLGEYFLNHSDLYQASKDQVQKLAEETEECTHLGLAQNGQLYLIYEYFGSNAVGVEYHDKKRQQPLNQLHSTGVGKCILAAMPESEVAEILDERGMPQSTQYTITDRDALFEELAEVRERGYAFADQELIPGIRAVAAPIEGPDGIEGAIAVTGPTGKFQGDRFREELPQMVTNAANICEVNLQTVRIK